MAQTYKIQSVKKTNTWESTFGEMQSYALALEGVGEPVQLNKKVPVKAEPQEGDELFGTLEEQERNGRTFYKIKLEQNQQANGGFKGQPRDDAAIKAQWAINQSTQIWIAQGCSMEAYDNIEKEAIHFYKMIERVKAS